MTISFLQLYYAYSVLHRVRGHCRVQLQRHPECLRVHQRRGVGGPVRGWG